MKRPLIISLLVLLLAAPLGLWLKRAEGPPTAPLIGSVSLTTVSDAALEGFKAGLREYGYADGENVRFLVKGPAENIEQIDGLVRQLLEAKVDMIFVSSTPATLAVQRATRGTGIPVVFAPVTDPVSTGIVKSLRQPGGNLTGVRLPSSEVRRLQWLLDLAPGTRHLYVPYNANDKSALVTLVAIKEAAAKLGLQMSAAPARNDGEIGTMIRNIPREADALFILRDSLLESRIGDFAAAALAGRLPLSAPSFTQVESGALFSYGFVHEKLGRQAARIAAQILRGARPGDMPVETAESYLFINLRTAQAIGLTMPDHVLRQAERVIR